MNNLSPPRWPFCHLTQKSNPPPLTTGQWRRIRFLVSGFLDLIWSVTRWQRWSPRVLWKLKSNTIRTSDAYTYAMSEYVFPSAADDAYILCTALRRTGSRFCVWRTMRRSRCCWSGTSVTWRTGGGWRSRRRSPRRHSGASRTSRPRPRPGRASIRWADRRRGQRSGHHVDCGVP